MSSNAVESIRDVEHLEDLLSEPAPGLVEAMARIRGDILILGVSGKMGPTLARQARRASDLAGVSRRIVGVARFGSGDQAARLEAHGVEAIRCDLLDPDQIQALPEMPNVIYLAGMKFGTTGQEAMTWAINTFLPGQVCRKFRRSRIVALSTGNVYGLSPADGPGSRETDRPDPRGEYAMSCLGRERIFEHFSRSLGIPVALIRLNYATEMRYGVLVDLARAVAAGEPIGLAMGRLNAIWQADANAMVLRALEHAESPPLVLNVTGPENLGVREVARRFGSLIGREPIFRGTEAADALLSDAGKAISLFGPPRVDADRMIGWIADWVRRGGPSLDKPTHFEVRDGQF
ncbi:NAD-dependent epimerase/dehydratase family protein [Tundrisphaera sp. TA3]|uniref:NAD-dependent epimerase/dehydratase family protein n=1 Tax=Tundrisphaera sp. TA3 TaxID=3435775 RepID=UPI003EB7ED08